MHDAGLLGPDVQLVHLNAVTVDDAKLLAGTGTPVVITPTVEAVMGHGASPYGRLVEAGVRPPWASTWSSTPPPTCSNPCATRCAPPAWRRAHPPPGRGEHAGRGDHRCRPGRGAGRPDRLDRGRQRADLLLLGGLSHLAGRRPADAGLRAVSIVLMDYFGVIVSSIAETLDLHGRRLVLNAGEAAQRVQRVLPGGQPAFGHAGLGREQRRRTDGAQVHLWGYVGGTNQQWLPATRPGGGYPFTARHSGRCLDVRDVSTADGGLLQQWACTGGPAQGFTLAARA